MNFSGKQSAEVSFLPSSTTPPSPQGEAEPIGETFTSCLKSENLVSLWKSAFSKILLKSSISLEFRLAGIMCLTVSSVHLLYSRSSFPVSYVLLPVCVHCEWCFKTTVIVSQSSHNHSGSSTFPECLHIQMYMYMYMYCSCM